MNGYLMQEQSVHRGQPTFIESTNPENLFAVVFEDDGETGYFYALQNQEGGGEPVILDALHIYQVSEKEEGTTRISIVWSKDWLKSALVLNNTCHALFDFEKQGGHNISEFPPPNEIWTKGERTLTNEMIGAIFG